MKHFTHLLLKDLSLELRAKEMVVVSIGLSLLLTAIAALGVNITFIPQKVLPDLFPALLWMIFLFSATTAVGRSYDYDLEHRAIDGILLSGVSPSAIYFSKYASSALILLFSHLLSIVGLAVLLDLSLMKQMPGLIAVSLLVVLGYCALSTLVAVIANASRLKNMLMPLVLMPLLFPLFLAALQITAEIMQNGAFDIGSVWVSLLVAVDVIYIALGFNLYEFVLRE